MSGEDSGESKEFPASDHKLAEARKRGQVAQSQDVVKAAGFVVGLVWLWSQQDHIGAELRAVAEAGLIIDGTPWREVLAGTGLRLGWLALVVLAPLLGLCLIATVLVSVIVTRGIVFSSTAITPDLARINPAEGAKRLFGRQAMVNFGLMLAKVAVLLSVLVAVGWQALGPVLASPRCGIGCSGTAMVGALGNLVWVSVGVFAAIAVVDVWVQRALFLQEMRMTRTELKQERKNTEGDPAARGQRAQLRRRLARMPIGPDRATLFVVDGSRIAVGLRYVQGETDAPVVVAKGRGAAAARLRRIADLAGVGAVDDPDLAAALLARIEPGQYVEAALIEGVVAAMQKEAASA